VAGEKRYRGTTKKQKKKRNETKKQRTYQREGFSGPVRRRGWTLKETEIDEHGARCARVPTDGGAG